MATYIFVPVPDQVVLDEIRDNWNPGRQAKGREPMPILQPRSVLQVSTSFLGIGCLRSLTASDRLYIGAHGNTQHIGGHRADGSTKYYEPFELANALKREGLKRSFRDIRVYTCHSGRDLGWLLGPSYAQRLKADLVQLGYSTNMSVVGYDGYVMGRYRNFADGLHKIYTTEYDDANPKNSEGPSYTVKRTY